MFKNLFIHLLRQEATSRMGASKNLDWRVGAALWRDPRVPTRAKMQAIALGFGALMLLNVLEIPLDALLVWFLPLVGIVADFAWNGLELVVVPFLVSSLALPFLAPREMSGPQTAGIPQPHPRNRVYDATNSKIR